MSRFMQRSLLPVPAELAFEWHTRKGSLERLTPPWEHVKILHTDGSLEPGSQVRLQVQIGPLKQNWVAEHRRYVPGVEFQDVQIRGPFSRFEHTHRIVPKDSDSCWLEDEIDYAVPLGLVGHWLADKFVRRKLKKMFDYRHAVTLADLEGIQQSQRETKTMKILITGATGLVGSALAPLLTMHGHEVYRLTRSAPEDANDIPWNPSRGELTSARLEGLDAVVHLAGENIAGSRWTAAVKDRIRNSRVEGTRLLCESLARLKQPPRVLVSASATGYYGDRGSSELTESASPGSGFLPEVCQAWEAACEPARNAGIRVVNPRIGVVLSAKGGALQKMLFPFRMGGGGIVGSGQQYWSWISLEDLIRGIEYCITHDQISGPVNFTAPQPCTNREFTKTLGHVLHRPTIVPVPGFAARLALGQMAQDLLLASTRVLPAKLLEAGYQFQFTELEAALRHELGVRQ